MSANHQDGPSSPEIAVKVEPDEVPTAMLTKLAIVVTIGVIASFIFVKALFDHTVEAELVAKGYEAGLTAVPASHGDAKTWE